jgi:hypothetical protein
MCTNCGIVWKQEWGEGESTSQPVTHLLQSRLSPFFFVLYKSIFFLKKGLDIMLKKLAKSTQEKAGALIDAKTGEHKGMVVDRRRFFVWLC